MYVDLESLEIANSYIQSIYENLIEAVLFEFHANGTQIQLSLS